jgi:UDP-2,3-diacylglucosamine hydrolase
VPRILLISDLHLSGERPAINTRFFEFLRVAASQAAALYVLGDLFEYWVGDDELDAADGDPLGRQVADAFNKLSRAGVSVALMRGNRDFLLGERFCDAAGMQLLQDPFVVQLEGTPTLLMHGDTLCTDDLDYQAWRRTARSDAWQRTFLSKPLPARLQEVRVLRERSKAKMESMAAEIMDVNADAVREAFRKHGVARLIHGHTHRPAHHWCDVDGRFCERWVMPDWYERGGYVAIERGVPRLTVF